jgi:hypothetical protein
VIRDRKEVGRRITQHSQKELAAFVVVEVWVSMLLGANEGLCEKSLWNENT